MYGYEYGYSNVGAGLGAGFLIMWLVTMAICIITIVANWKLFVKAGMPGWTAIVPFYNTYCMTKLAGMSVLWFVLYFVPCVNIVASVWIVFDFLKSYEVPVGMRVAAVFFPFIVYPIVAFSPKYQYIGVGE